MDGALDGSIIDRPHEPVASIRLQRVGIEAAGEPTVVVSCRHHQLNIDLLLMTAPVGDKFGAKPFFFGNFATCLG